MSVNNVMSPDYGIGYKFEQLIEKDNNNDAPNKPKETYHLFIQTKYIIFYEKLKVVKSSSIHCFVFEITFS